MRKITMDMELRFIDHVSDGANSASKSVDNIEKEAKQASDSLDKLGKKKTKPSIDADSSRVDKKLSKLDSVLKKFDAKRTKTTIDADDKATSKLNKLLNKAKSWAGTKYRAFVEAKDNATAKLTKLMDKARSWGKGRYEAFIGLKDSKALSTLNSMSNKLRSFTGKTWSAVLRIKDTFTAPLTRLQNMLFNVKNLIAGIAVAWASSKIFGQSINVADAYSSAKISFSTLLGESQGQQMMDDLDEFAAATPFNTSNVISNAQKMLAMGWDAEDIIGDMEIIGNAAAATGKLDEGLESIVRALSQIKTKGRLSTEELNQLAEAGISAKAMLAEQLGYGTGDTGIAKMTEDLEDGKIASDKAIAALLAGMQKYDGMMESMANETVDGLKSQIQDAFEINIVRKWGQGLQDGAKRGLGTVVSLLDEAEEGMAEFGDTLYDAGAALSNWGADKLENAIERIAKITGSYEFQKASLGEKAKMLWNGVIVDPLKEWWEGGGREKTAETAGEIGGWMGKTITAGLLAIFGMTDILDDETAAQLGESGGMTIAQSFAQGFKENFDGSAITDAFVDAISDVWNALPWWAKMLIGGYAVGKVAGGISSFAGGVANFAGGVANAMGGFQAHVATVGPSLVTGSGILGTIGKAGVGLGATTTGGALLAGSLGIAGGVAGGASILKGGYDIYQSYKAREAGNETEAEAYAASGNSALNGVAAGALAGAAIGSVVPVIGTAVGALVGAGIGGVTGWIAGDKKAKEIRLEAEAARYASEEMKAAIETGEASAEELAEIFERAKWENATEHFGDIALSLREIEALASSIVWGDDIGYYESFSSAVQTAESSLKSMKTAAEQANRWMWKARVGMNLDADDIESMKTSFDEYINSAKSYVENKHYEFTTAVSLLVDVESEEGKSIIESGNTFYTALQKQLDELGTKLSSTIDISLEDGVITLDEEKEIANLQQQIADITEKVSNAEQQAQIELVKVKFGGGNLDYESFENFMAQMQTTIDERMTANDEAFVASVSSLKLRLDQGALTQEEYDAQLQTLIDGYNSTNVMLKAQIRDLELQMIAEAYTDPLGSDALGDLNRALQYAIDNGLDPVEISPSVMAEQLNIELDGNTETISKISEMLSGVLDQIGLIPVEVDGELYFQIAENAGEEVQNTVDGAVPDTVDTTVGVNITGEKTILNQIEILMEDFGIKETQAANILWQLSSAKTITDQVEIMCEEFGIERTEALTILWELTGEKNIMNTIGITASMFGIPSRISQNLMVDITAKTGTIKNDTVLRNVPKFRGGIVGASNLEAFATGGIADGSDGGMVRGGAQLITVAEEGSPEMIIPLSSQRRQRGIELWEKAGNMLDVPGFARGGSTGRNRDEGFRFQEYGSGTTEGGKSVEVNVNGMKVELHVHAEGSGNITDAIIKAIKEQAGEISDALAGVIADALVPVFENTPVRGGA